MASKGFLFEDDLSSIDPEVEELISLEEERQFRKLVMIASESLCPEPVRRVLASPFTNLYAEGLPPAKMEFEDEETLLDFEHMLAYHRRYFDRRYYKGCDYVNFVESLAQKRVCQLFATDKASKSEIKISPDQIYANVQPLSGSPANNAIYEAFLKPGDTVMGMSLTSGGHLTHGSPVNRSGKYYRVVSYEVDRKTGKLDYDKILELAIRERPKLIIAGYSAYPLDIDWKMFKEIADRVGAILVADIAHPAGLVVAGQFSNPVGYADVVVFTTHKTLCGPRGAVILTTDPEKARRIDAAVFPGEQGGPHINNIAAKAVCFKIAQTKEFKKLQARIVENARTLAKALQDLGLELAYGGTDSHMVLIDLKSVETPTGVPLDGETASRILDMCHITCNKNTIVGDESAAFPSAIRLGTTIVTQLGMGPEEMRTIARLIHKVLTNIYTFRYAGSVGPLGRGKIDPEIVEEVREEVEKLVARVTGKDFRKIGHGYPHYYVKHLPEEKKTPLFEEHKKLGATIGVYNNWKLPKHYGNPEREKDAINNGLAITDLGDSGIIEVRGERAKPLLQEVTSKNIYSLGVGEGLQSFLFGKNGVLIDEVIIIRWDTDNTRGEDKYLLLTHPQRKDTVKCWIRNLSDGYTLFDDNDIHAKIEGPVVVRDREANGEVETGITRLSLVGEKLPEFLGKLDSKLDYWRATNYKLYTTKLAGTEVGVFRVGHTENHRMDLLVPARYARNVWGYLLKEGRAFGIQPVGRETWGNSVGAELPQNPGNIDCEALYNSSPTHFDVTKPYFIGHGRVKPKTSPKKKVFRFEQPKLKRQTCLYEKHLELTKKSRFVLFAGWLMPVCYTRIGEEHEAVRTKAGLFDLSHMGVLEVSGEYATRFLDLVTTNYVPMLRVGQSHYSYILDPNGSVMDDVYIYKLANDRYMIVVNAVNAEKIKAWFEAVNSGEVLIDVENPWKMVEDKVEIRDLKDERSGQDQRVDLGLQGPNSLEILQKISDDPEQRLRISQLRRSELIHEELRGIDLIISRSGYTGEEVGYELYVHPRKAPELWDMILEEGASLGVKPAGLGARDSLRIEAGFPLYGHELAGPHDISPAGAGYAPFVKLHKPYFIGRKKFIEKEKTRTMEIIRFKMDNVGIRAVKPGFAVINRKGMVIGHVTSCALIGETQLGMAYVDRKYTAEGTKIGVVFPTRGAQPLATTTNPRLGERLPTYEPATVLPRFPFKPKKILKTGEE